MEKIGNFSKTSKRRRTILKFRRPLNVVFTVSELKSAFLTVFFYFDLGQYLEKNENKIIKEFQNSKVVNYSH